MWYAGSDLSGFRARVWCVVPVSWSFLWRCCAAALLWWWTAWCRGLVCLRLLRRVVGSMVLYVLVYVCGWRGCA